MLTIRWKIPVWISGYFQWQLEHYFLEFPEKRMRYTDFSTGISVPFKFSPGISGIFGWMVRWPKIQQFPEKTFLGSSYHLCPFWNFRNFWLTRKHSLILLTITICKYLSDIWLRVRITVSADDSCFSMICWRRILYCTQMLWLPMNSAHASPRYDSHIPWSGGRVL